MVESTKKNSDIGRPSIEPSIESVAPASDTSSIVQARRQVPSIAIIVAGYPRSNTTRFAFRSFISSRAALCLPAPSELARSRSKMPMIPTCDLFW